MSTLLLQDEREERELRKVEMQTQKAENMIEHEAEIYARPPRTWFQTEQQKKQSAKRARSGSSEEAEENKGKNAKKQKREEANGKKEQASKQDRAQRQKDQLVEVIKLYIPKCCFSPASCHQTEMACSACINGLDKSQYERWCALWDCQYQYAIRHHMTACCLPDA